MRERFAFIINAHGRKVRHDPRLIDDLRAMFGDRGPFFVTKTPEELPGIIADIRQQDLNTIFICGGDGTLRQTLSTLVSVYGDAPLPRIGMLKGGTMNVVAGGCGIWRGPRRQLKHVLQRVDQKRPPFYVKRRLLRVNDQFGFIFGVGGFSRFIEAYQKDRDPTPFWAFRLVATTILSAFVNGPLSRGFFTHFDAQVSLGEEDKENWRVTNLSAASIVDNGFGSKPYFGADAEKGTFGLLSFTCLPRTLLYHLPMFFLGKKVEDEKIIQQPATSVSIELKEPMVPMLDGDLLPADTTFHLQTGPLFRVLVH